MKRIIKLNLYTRPFFPTSSACLLLGFALAGHAQVAGPSGDGAGMGALAPLPAVRSAIAEDERAFLGAVLAQDQDTLNTLLADDFVYVHENGLLSTKAQFLSDFVAKGYVAAELDQEEPARQYGGTVLTIGAGHLRLKGETPHPPTTVTHIWIEQGRQVGARSSPRIAQGRTDREAARPAGRAELDGATGLEAIARAGETHRGTRGGLGLLYADE